MLLSSGFPRGKAGPSRGPEQRERRLLKLSPPESHPLYRCQRLECQRPRRSSIITSTSSRSFVSGQFKARLRPFLSKRPSIFRLHRAAGTVGTRLRRICCIWCIGAGDRRRSPRVQRDGSGSKIGSEGGMRTTACRRPSIQASTISDHSCIIWRRCSSYSALL